MDLQLTGKRAVVTGGSRGIGYAIASALAAEGADLALLARDPARLEAAARQLAAAHGRRVLALAADTTDDAAVRAAIARTAGELGGVDILVNNAAEPAAPGSPRALADVDRRRPARGDRHQGARLPALCPRRGAVHDRPGLGPDHQHQRPGRPQRGHAVRARSATSPSRR